MSFPKALDAALAKTGKKPADITSDSVNASYISKLQRGRLADPTWEKACAIISALGMDPNSFRELELSLGDDDRP